MRKIKVCPDPQCEEVALNCNTKETRCRNCGGWLIAIDQKTYEKKFQYSCFQIDYSSTEYSWIPPKVKQNIQYSLFD